MQLTNRSPPARPLRLVAFALWYYSGADLSTAPAPVQKTYTAAGVDVLRTCATDGTGAQPPPPLLSATRGSPRPGLAAAAAPGA